MSLFRHWLKVLRIGQLHLRASVLAAAVAVLAAPQVASGSSKRKHRHAGSAVASTAADPSGRPMPKGDLSGWHHVFADNFAGESVPLGAFSGCTWPSGATVLQLDCSGLAPYPMV